MRWLSLVLLITGCEPMPTSGNPFAPASPAEKSVLEPASVNGGEASGGFDFEGDDRTTGEGAAEAELTAIQLQARMLGIPASEFDHFEAAPDAPAAPAAPQAEATAPTAPPSLWEPGVPVPAGGWGVRLIGTLPEVQPPRAVLALQDGTEVVVTAGDLLADQRIVIMAVGRHAIQIAEITPQGFYAEVRTQTLPLLFGGGSAAVVPLPVP